MATTDLPVAETTGARQRSTEWVAVLVAQIAILVVFLAMWEYAPKAEWIREIVVFADPYYISSPTEVGRKSIDLMLGRDALSIWPYLTQTFVAACLGILIGVIGGAICGLILSESRGLSLVLQPYLVAINAIPRIALVPIVVLIFGPTQTSSVVTTVLVVFFLVFFNAYEGGKAVPIQVVQNARILGATRSQVALTIRARYVQAWTFAALPNAVSFGFVGVVTAEILTGTVGMGRLISDSVSTVQPALTFAVVIMLSVLGLVLVGAANVLSRRALHWWVQGDSGTR